MTDFNQFILNFKSSWCGLTGVKYLGFEDPLKIENM